MVSATTTLALLLSAGAACAQQQAWQQCGGNTWKGDSRCITGYYCSKSSDFYSQCIPGTDPNSQALPTPTSSGSGGGGAAPTGGPGSTLQNGYLWIRAVAAPNFHKYLQTKPQYVPGTAIMDSYTTAGQFQIVDGQLEQLISDGLLYANVQPSTEADAKKLSVTFETTKNTYGTFAFSGDAVQWSHPDVPRQNLSAWLVCAAQSLWVNLGAYGYMTPEGCADQTIHYYNDSHAVD